MRGDDTAAGVLAVLGAAALWALIGPLSRELTDAGLGATEIGWWRAAGAGAAVLIHAEVRGRRPRPVFGDRRLTGRILAMAVVGVSVFFVALPAAIEEGGITLAFVLLYTAPVWVAVYALARREVDDPVRTVWLVGVATAGVVAVAVGGGTGDVELSAVAVAWGLAAGLSYASYYVWGTVLFERLGDVETYWYILPIGALLLLPVVDLSWPTTEQLPWLVGLVFVSTYLPYLLIAFGLRHVEAPRAAVIAMLEPVLASTIGWAVYDERLSVLGWVGAVAVVVAATISARTVDVESVVEVR